MEVYVLDSLLRRVACVDAFESLVWTERFSSTGDFELQLSSTYGHRSLFTVGTRLAINNSTRVMTVETVQDSTDDSGKEVLDVSGPSLEDVLNNRVAFNTNTDLTTNPSWVLTDTPGNICRTVFNRVVRTATLNMYDAIPFLQPGKIYPDNTIPEPASPITVTITPQSLYDLIKGICDANELGFRLVRPPAGGQLYFDIYSGLDLTTRQTANQPVIFSADMDDLQNTKELTQFQGSKNVAYVYSPAGFQIVLGEHVPADIDGFDRRIMFVDGSSVTSDNPDISGALIQLGTDALTANRASSLFDGEIDQHSQFTYDVDYRLGDLVEVRNKDGNRTYKRVTEQIFACDDGGDRSYPTLSADLFAGTADWASMNNDATTWLDHDGDTITWSDLP